MLLAFNQANIIEVGCDEAGRGCLAGGVFAAAVILDPNFSHPKLNDSKQLSLKSRNELRLLIEKEAIGFGVGFASPEEIDEINILHASFLAMHRALDKLNLPFEHILVDGNRFTPYGDIPHTCMIKGDSRFYSIAAASILAKTYRDEYMENISVEYPMYDWIQNKGYPTRNHRESILIHGPSPYHRKSFRVSTPTP